MVSFAQFVVQTSRKNDDYSAQVAYSLAVTGRCECRHALARKRQWRSISTSVAFKASASAVAPSSPILLLREIERGDRRVGLVMFAVTVTQPEPGQPANQTMTPTGGSPALTEDASPVLQQHDAKYHATWRGKRRA